MHQATRTQPTRTPIKSLIRAEGWQQQSGTAALRSFARVSPGQARRLLSPHQFPLTLSWPWIAAEWEGACGPSTALADTFQISVLPSWEELSWLTEQCGIEYWAAWRDVTGAWCLIPMGKGWLVLRCSLCQRRSSDHLFFWRDQLHSSNRQPWAISQDSGQHGSPGSSWFLLYCNPLIRDIYWYLPGLLDRRVIRAKVLNYINMNKHFMSCSNLISRAAYLVLWHEPLMSPVLSRTLDTWQSFKGSQRFLLSRTISGKVESINICNFHPLDLSEFWII